MTVPVDIKVADEHRGLLLRRRRPGGERNVIKVYETRVAAIEAVKGWPQLGLVELPLLDRRRQELVKMDEACEGPRVTREVWLIEIHRRWHVARGWISRRLNDRLIPPPVKSIPARNFLSPVNPTKEKRGSSRLPAVIVTVVITAEVCAKTKKLRNCARLLWGESRKTVQIVHSTITPGETLSAYSLKCMILGGWNTAKLDKKRLTLRTFYHRV